MTLGGFWVRNHKSFHQSTWGSYLKLQELNTKMDSPTPSGTLSSPTSSVVSTPTPLNDEPESFPDYSIWTPDRFAAFPGLGLYHEPKKELKWWWKYGFRLKDPKRPLKLQQIWVCEACFLVKKKTVFVASGSRSIEKHLKENHRVVEKGVSCKANRLRFINLHQKSHLEKCTHVYAFLTTYA